MTRDRPTVDNHIRLALDATGTGLWEWDLDTGRLFWDKTCDQIFGYEKGSCPSTYDAFIEHIVEADRDAVDTQLTRAIERSDQYEVEFRIERPDGDRRWIRSCGIIEEDESGKATRVVGTQTDVTTEQERRRELESYRKLFENTTDCVVEIERVGGDSLIRRVNDAFEEVFGYAEAEIRDQDIHEVLTPEEYKDQAMKIRQEYLKGDQPVVEVTRNTADGQREFLMRAVNFEDRFYVVYTDITERKEYEQELEKLNTRLQLALEETDTGVWEWNLDTDEVQWDETSERLFGYDAGEFAGTFAGFADRVPDEDLQQVEEQIDHAIETGEQYRAEFRVHPPTDDQRWIQARGVVEYDDSGTPERLLGIQTDITAHKQSERALEQARKELRQVIDLIPDPLYVKNRDDEVLLSNEANAKLHGLTPDEIEGLQEREFEADVENIENFDTYRQREIAVMETGEATTFEEELTDPDGDKHVFKTSRIPYEAAGRDEDAVLGYARDVTELKEYEQELEQQRDNLEVLTQMLSHDVRNDLQLIAGYADLLLQECEDGDTKDYITTIQSSADHAVELTETAREIAEVMLAETTQSQQVNLRNVLKNEVSEVQSSYPNAAVTCETTIPSVPVSANEMISSVFRNLLKNAIQHNDKEIVEVTVSATERDDVVAVRIADNGPGISDTQKESLFGKGEHGLESAGSGIGLYLVDTLVTGYGGEVWIEDNDPEGTIFIVEIPTTE